MKIVVAFPPLYEKILKAFPLVASRRVIFAWSDRIYNPHNVVIGPSLIAHESVHGHRQGDCVEEWWERYMDEPTFRLAEEIPAHIAEYEVLSGFGSRHERRRARAIVAARLTDPLYGHGGLVSKAEAMKILTERL